MGRTVQVLIGGLALVLRNDPRKARVRKLLELGRNGSAGHGKHADRRSRRCARSQEEDDLDRGPRCLLHGVADSLLGELRGVSFGEFTLEGARNLVGNEKFIRLAEEIAIPDLEIVRRQIRSGRRRES